MFYRQQTGKGPGDGTPPPSGSTAVPAAGVSRNLVKVLAVTIFLAGVAALVFGEHGLMDVRRSRRELREVREKVQVKQEAVARLRAEVNRLESDPMALERVAREQLNLAKPGEIIILLPREKDWGKPQQQLP